MTIGRSCLTKGRAVFYTEIMKGGTEMVSFVVFLSWCIVGGVAYGIVWFIRKWSLPRKTVYGYLTIDEQRYAESYMNSYSIDSEGKTYTHIGGGGEVSVPNGYTLKLYPGENVDFTKDKPILLHSLPGRMSIKNVHFGYGLVTYSEEKHGKKYYVSTE